MEIEQTIIIVKPDGLSKGLVGFILDAINQRGLRVVDSLRTKLTRQWVKELYGEKEKESYFDEAVNWVSSSPVLFLLVEGRDAVDVVKREIIGIYPNGIRGKFSENRVKNVAHAADSVLSAQREILLSKQIFEGRREMKKKKLSGKMIFALTGMSECGKSTVGKYLDSRGIPRLKILRLFEKVRDILAPGVDLKEFIKKQEQKDPYALWNSFIDELLTEMEKQKVNMVSIESLYGGGLGPFIKQQLGDHFCIVFIDASQEKRLELQMIREGLSDKEEAKRLLLPRDKIKAESGIYALKEISGEIIINSGTLDDLYCAIDEMIARYKAQSE